MQKCDPNGEFKFRLCVAASLRLHYGAVFESVLSQVVCPGKKILPGHLPRQKLLTGTFAAANVPVNKSFCRGKCPGK